MKVRKRFSQSLSVFVFQFFHFAYWPWNKNQWNEVAREDENWNVKRKNTKITTSENSKRHKSEYIAIRAAAGVILLFYFRSDGETGTSNEIENTTSSSPSWNYFSFAFRPLIRFLSHRSIDEATHEFRTAVQLSESVEMLCYLAQKFKLWLRSER